MKKTRWLTPAEQHAWRGYNRMRALVDLRLSRDLARDSGLSDADYDVLSNLSEVDSRCMRLSELAALMLWSKSRLSHHVTRMEQRGLVERENCASDGRGAFVVLTEDGWTAIEAAAPPHVESVRRHLIDLLSPEQVRVLGDIADTVIAHINDDDGSASAVAWRE